MSTSREFRQVLIQSLKQGLDSFEMSRLREEHAVSEDDARKAARDVYFSQCLKAANDWTITDAERQVLRRLGERLELSEKHQNECQMVAKNRVFDVELKEAMDDEGISNGEADALAHLRKCLGLAPMAAEDFGPPAPRPKRRRKASPILEPMARDIPRRAEWAGPWGPPIPVLGIPYSAFLLSFGGCGAIGAYCSYTLHLWSPLLAALVVAVLIIGYLFFGSYCWQCGSTWCLSRAGSDTECSFFGGSTTYIYYECERCGAVKTVRRSRSDQSSYTFWDLWR